MKHLLIYGFILTSTFASAQGLWLEKSKSLYVDRCAISIASQGAPASYAKPFCICIADGMESEFGMHEYNAMMKAQPNPSGSADDKRLYKIMSSCSNKNL